MAASPFDQLDDEDLAESFGSGRIPPLLNAADPCRGLINPRLLEIFAKGMSGEHCIPLGILLSSNNYCGAKTRWTKGNFWFNERARCDWMHFCQVIRSNGGEDFCNACYQQHASVAEAQGKSIAYLCCHGMINFAVPVRVRESTVAILFAGQARPKSDCTWPGRLVLTLPSPDASKSTDLWQSARDRVTEAIAKYGLSTDTVSEALSFDRLRKPLTEVGPEQVTAILHDLDCAAGHLSGLATNTYELRRLHLASRVRFEFTTALASLDTSLSNIEGAFGRLGQALARFSTLMDLTYAVLCRVQMNDGKIVALEPVAETGLGPDFAKNGPFALPELPKEQITGYGNAWSNSEVTYLDLKDFSSVPFFKDLQAHLRGAGGTVFEACLVVPSSTSQFLVVMGNSCKVLPRAANDVDVEAIVELVRTACLTAEALSLLRDFRESHRAADRFVEELMHDMRAPIQGLITNVALIKRLGLSPEEYRNRAARLGAAITRLNLKVRKTWTAQRLYGGQLVYRRGPASVPEVVAVAAEALADLSRHIGVEVVVDNEALRLLPHLDVDRDIFLEVMVNLLDNGIKYSTPPSGRRVLVNGRLDGNNVVVSIGNRGTEIKSEEKVHIFERYYRTTAGRRMRSDGTGIGLSIVKHFVDHYGGQIVVTSDQIAGTTDYLTVFSLQLKVGAC